MAIKTHFGEVSEGGFIPPWQLAPLAEAVRERGAVPFLVETSVLNKSPRSNAVTHLELARRHGFADLGVLASRDPVAIDQTSLDLIHARRGFRLEKRSYPEHNASVQLAHAEAVGLGRREHEIVEV